MKDVLLDALIDSAKILAILLVFNFIIALFESKLAKAMVKSKKWTPLVGVSLSLLPQCGFSVVATDLYQHRRITMGTLIGVYLATSDEALPILLSHPDKIIMVLPLLAIKFVIGLAVAYLVDFIFKNQKLVTDIPNEIKSNKSKSENLKIENTVNTEIVELPTKTKDDHHHGCCNHKIQSEDKLQQYLWHPLIHSLKIFVYILIINIVFGICIYYIGEDKISAFLQTNRYVAPFFAVLVGIIPNCAASVILTQMYIMGGIGFGACIGGLCINAGLGLMVLFKSKKDFKNNMLILGILFVVSLLVGYITSFICNFN